MMGTDSRKDSDTDRRLERHTPSGMEVADTLRRIEVITGAGRRRRWSGDAKAAIVAESYEPGASVSAVARRHDMSPSLLFLWRRKSQQVGGPAIVGRPEPLFVPLKVADVTAANVRPDLAAIEIEVCDVRVRITGRVDGTTLREVLSAIRGGRR